MLPITPVCRGSTWTQFELLPRPASCKHCIADATASSSVKPCRAPIEQAVPCSNRTSRVTPQSNKLCHVPSGQAVSHPNRSSRSSRLHALLQAGSLAGSNSQAGDDEVRSKPAWQNNGRPCPNRLATTAAKNYCALP